MKTIFPWVGGKRFLVKEIAKYFPEKIETYYEPFLGSGAMLMHLAPRVAFVNDINRDLINVFRQIHLNADGVLEITRYYKPNKETFYKVRDRYNKEYISNTERAGIFIYLMKLCYRGKYTVNKNGKFNQAFAATGDKNSMDFATRQSFIDSVYELRDYLLSNIVVFTSEDFYLFLTQRDYKKGDFVYIDPPYVETNGKFTGYTPYRFGMKEQKILKYVCDGLTRHGVKFLLSNSKSETINEMYKDYNIREIKSYQKLFNTHTAEYVVTNY